MWWWTSWAGTAKGPCDSYLFRPTASFAPSVDDEVRPGAVPVAAAVIAVGGILAWDPVRVGARDSESGPSPPISSSGRGVVLACP